MFIARPATTTPSLPIRWGEGRVRGCIKESDEARPGVIADFGYDGVPRLAAHMALTMCIREATVGPVIEIRKTEIFAHWLDGLRDLQARARVQARLERLAGGNPGDVGPVGEGVSELRSTTVPVTGCILNSEGER